MDTSQILISWLRKKPADLDLLCFLKRIYSGSNYRDSRYRSLLYFILSDWDPDEVFPLLPPAEAERRRSLQNLRHVVSQAYDELDTLVVQVDLTKYVFPFENLVFEGGGNKGLAYCGAVRVSNVDIQFCCTHGSLNLWIFATLRDIL